jgi:ankyrin repeat protein
MSLPLGAAGGAGDSVDGKDGPGPAAIDTTPDAPTAAERSRVAAASAAERAECEARYIAARAAATAAGASAPVRGPAADSALGERFLDVVALVSANGFALDARPARFLCGLTFRLGARRADGSVDRAGFRGGTADVIDCALRLQAPWLEAARRAPRERSAMLSVRELFLPSADHTTNLMRAAEAGDEVRVRELLAAGAPLRCVDSLLGKSALHLASEQGSACSVAALLEADAAGDMINAQDSTGNTPLVLASEHGREGAVRALLARGARQELRNWYGDTALKMAASNGHSGVIELLCAAPGLQVDATDDGSGYTPLIGASFFLGREGAVRTLLAAGARQELQDRNGRTAMHVASKEGHAGVVGLLCAAPGAALALALRDGKGRTPLAALSHPPAPFFPATKAAQDACAAVMRAHGAS